jgi:uncharacterized protein YfaT (DUF1175 family)
MLHRLKLMPRVSLRFPSAGWNDSQRDGIPDCIGLRSFNDRENFRRWFTGIAELQFITRATHGNQSRDCAGLVRFALREALREHNRLWFRKMGAAYEPFAPDVHAYTLERNPLGENFSHKVGRVHGIRFDKRRVLRVRRRAHAQRFQFSFRQPRFARSRIGRPAFFINRGRRNFPIT